MSNCFQYRIFQPGDEQGIFDLLKKVFSKWSQQTLEYWKWKYLKNPYGVNVYVATDGGRIIGVICDVALRLKLFDSVIGCTYSDDVATDPDYRGQGVYSKLFAFYKRDQVARGNLLALWQTENPIITKVKMDQPYTPLPFPMARMIKIRDVDQYLRSREKHSVGNKIIFSLLKSTNSLSNIAYSDPKPSNFSIEEVTLFDEGVDVFWDKVKAEYDFIVEKKGAYLNWRYRSAEPDCMVRVAKLDGDVLGFSAFRATKRGDVLEGSIMDLLALPGRSDVVEGLLGDALVSLDKLGVNSVYCPAVKKSPLRRILAGSDFIDVSRASRSVFYYTAQPPHQPAMEKVGGVKPSKIYFNLY